MGKEVSETQPTRQELLSILRRFSQLKNWDRPAGETLQTIAEEFFRTGTVRGFQQRDNSIYVAGFLYLDQAKKQRDYQFFNETKGDSSDYTLGYTWKSQQSLGPFQAANDRGKQQDAATFIDSLFYAMRKGQSPWGKSVPGGKSLPEYLAWLPQAGQTQDDEIWLPRSSNELRELYGWHYCPYGEVVFFLYLWRLLLWSSLCFDSPNDLWYQSLNEDDFGPSLDSLCAKNKLNTIWTSRVWNSITGYENCLYRWAYTAGTEFAKPELVRDGLEYFDSFETGSVGLWERDLRRLLICTERGDVDVALEPVLRFAQSTMHALAEPIPARMARCCQELSDAGIINAQKNFTGRGIADADRYLRAAATAWLSCRPGSEMADSWEGSIAELHKRSRFPIIPYFYWNAIDRMPKTHVVIPIWRSWTVPVSADVFLAEPKNPLDDPPKTEATTSIVGISVVGMSPLQSDLETQRQHENYGDPYSVVLRYSTDCQRVDWIDDVLIRASLPQVDAHYYGDIERARANQERISFQESIDHDQRKPVRIIGDLLRNSSLRSEEKILYTQALTQALLRKLSSYSALGSDQYEERNWKYEASESVSDCTISQMFNWSVLVALLRVAVDDSLRDLRSVLFATTEDAMWERLNATILPYMNSDLGPAGDFTFVDANGRITVTVAYTGQDVLIPRRIFAQGGGSPYSKIYAGFSFLFDEIVLNTFKHQFNDSKMISEHPIQISVTVSTLNSISITLRFSPASESPGLKVKRAIGLSSLDYVLNVLGFRSKTYMRLTVGSESNPVFRRLPYFEVLPLSPLAREWGIMGIPAAAFKPATQRRGESSGF